MKKVEFASWSHFNKFGAPSILRVEEADIFVCVALECVPPSRKVHIYSGVHDTGVSVSYVVVVGPTTRSLALPMKRASAF